MTKYIKLLICSVALCWFIGPASAQEQGGASVALLVIDQFEVISEPVEISDENAECVFTIDGQDSYKWEGSAHGLTAILHPFPDPHGRQVYKTVGESLFAAGWSIDPLQRTTGNQVQTLPDDWMRDIEVWQRNGNQIYVVAVDTDAHTADAIVARITDAMSALYQTWDITNFVINMSFALIPCDSIPMANFTSYVLSLDFPSLAELPIYQELGNPLELCNAAIQEIIERDGLTQLENSTCESLAATADDTNTSEDDAKVVGHILLEVLSSDIFQPMREVVYWTSLRQRSLDALDNVYGSGAQLSLGLAKLAQTNPDAMAEFFDTEDDANDEIQNLNEFCASLSDDANCIAVASAGNDSLDHPYEPASYRHVIAASAEYELPGCPPEEEDVLAKQLTEAAEAGISDFVDDESDGFDDEVATVIQGLFDPLSNDGEVAVDGVYNGTVDLQVPCLHLWGTSFSAPRLSFVMANYLAEGGSADVCTGSEGDSKPPLNFSELNEAALLASARGTQWPDFTLAEATSKYCPAVPIP